jgi:rare lipoprotein A
MLSAVVQRLVIVAGAASLLASCAMAPTPSDNASKEYFSEKEYGKASPRVVANNKRVPKGGGRYVIGEPYRVAGKTYIPAHNAEYSATGNASWYGSAFHGRLTANGEIYDVKGLTAAHPTMPLPSYARVTNLKNGRSMVVRVNDRGPFAHGRVIDVSEAVAEVLDFKQAGVTKVQVDYVGPAEMDGRDHKMLMASYAGPSSKQRRSLFGRQPKPDSFMVATAPPPPSRPGRLPDDAFAPTPLASSAPMVLTPVSAAAYTGDPLGPLIMRTGFASSYAPAPPTTAAHQAAADMARADLKTALTRAAEEKGRALGDDSSGPAAVIQLGTFSDPTNAARIAGDFRRFGQVDLIESVSGDRTLRLVRLTVAPSNDPQAVIAAAGRAGLSDAFLLNR